MFENTLVIPLDTLGIPLRYPYRHSNILKRLQNKKANTTYYEHLRIHEGSQTTGLLAMQKGGDFSAPNRGARLQHIAPTMISCILCGLLPGVTPLTRPEIHDLSEEAAFRLDVTLDVPMPKQARRLCWKVCFPALEFWLSSKLHIYICIHTHAYIRKYALI